MSSGSTGSRRGQSGPPATSLGKALRAAAPALVTAIIFSLFINLLMFVSPLYMLQIYDRVLASRSETTLIGLTVLAATLLAVYALLEMLRSKVLVRAGLIFDSLVSEATFRAVQRAHLRRPGAGHAQCLRDLDSVREFLTGAGLIALCDVPWFPIFVAACFILHPWFGALALAASLLTLTLTALNEFSTRKTLAQAARHSMQASLGAQSALRNAEVIHAMGITGALRSRWSSQHAQVLHDQATASDRSGAIVATTKFLRVFLQVCVLGLGAYLAINREISPGSMIAASILLGRAMQPIELAVANWKGILGARSAYGRLRELFQEAAVEQTRMQLPRPRGDVSVQELVAAPPAQQPGVRPRPVLNGISFNVPAGQVIGVIGPSAAGKSSLARVLLGVWPVAAGSVRLDGFDISQWDQEQLGPYLGYLPQDIELFAGTVAENIARTLVTDKAEIDEGEVIAAATLAGCHELIQQLPQGYNTEIGDGGQVLSGGQRQRIGLARALYRRPSLVVLDEPNSNLDSLGEEALLNAIKSLKATQTTTIIITHKMNVLAIVDKILLMNSGNIQLYGDRDEILSQLSAPRVVRTSDANAAERPGSTADGRTLRTADARS